VDRVRVHDHIFKARLVRALFVWGRRAVVARATEPWTLRGRGAAAAAPSNGAGQLARVPGAPTNLELAVGHLTTPHGKR